MSTTPVPPPPPASSNNNNECSVLSGKRDECYRKHELGDYHRDSASGTKYQKCWIPVLKAKRCLAFRHCARDALDYYQSPSDRVVEGVNGPKDKGYCSAYDEAYCRY